VRLLEYCLQILKTTKTDVLIFTTKYLQTALNTKLTAYSVYLGLITCLVLGLHFFINNTINTINTKTIININSASRGHSLALSGQAGMRHPLCFISTK
jgi:hypothetical protein